MKKDQCHLYFGLTNAEDRTKIMKGDAIMKRKIMAVLLSAAMTGSLAGCGSTSGGDEAAKGDKSSGKVYYLNFKPEQADQWVELAKEYTDETGVQVDVQTAASGTYESQLKSEMAKDEAPTLFQVNGPVGLATWKNYCYDLSAVSYTHLRAHET